MRYLQANYSLLLQNKDLSTGHIKILYQFWIPYMDHGKNIRCVVIETCPASIPKILRNARAPSTKKARTKRIAATANPHKQIRSPPPAMVPKISKSFLAIPATVPPATLAARTAKDPQKQNAKAPQTNGIALAAAIVPPNRITTPIPMRMVMIDICFSSLSDFAPAWSRLERVFIIS